MDIYDSPLTADQQAVYDTKFDSKASRDYDMRGWFLDNQGVEPNAEGQHYTDKYKKPWHPTFSDESQYNNVAGNQGGSWGKTADGKDTFIPGPTNVKTHGLLGLIDYFDKVEPDVHLMLPRSSDLSQ